MKLKLCVVVHQMPNCRVEHERWSWNDMGNKTGGWSFSSLEECLEDARRLGFAPRREGEVMEEEEYWRWVRDGVSSSES